MLKQASNKANRKERYIAKVWSDIQYMFRAQNVWSKGAYKDISKSSFPAIVYALLYFIFPIDVLPDFISLSSLVDDATVISYVATRLA